MTSAEPPVPPEGTPPGVPPPPEAPGRAAKAPSPPSGGAAVLVAIGILASRLFGLVRTRLLARYLGLEDAHDAYAVAIRIPNILQNLFGEGALSASFIPVYAGLLGEGDEREAGRTAGAVFALLSLVTALLVLLGLLAAPLIVDVLASGFDAPKRDLTVLLVRIIFPGMGLLVLSAWCLGVLNSHGKFLLSYSAPVLWNLAIIGALIAGGAAGAGQMRLAELAAWGAVAGSVLQFAIQLPWVLRLAPRLRLGFGRASSAVRSVVRNFIPALMSRGAVQISTLVDLAIVGRLPMGAASGLAAAQMIYTLPVSLFGMSVSASELPAMSRVSGSGEEIAAALRLRLETAMRRVAFFVIPSAAAFLAFGDMVAGVILQSGRFGRAESLYVWGILAGSAVGLLAATLARLLSSAFYALRDTRTPLRYALVRIGLGAAVGIPSALYLPEALGLDPRWGTAALTLTSGIVGWIEFLLLRRALSARTGRPELGAGLLVRLWAAAAIAVALGWGVKLLIGVDRPLLGGLLVLGVFGACYLGLTSAMQVGETPVLLRRARDLVRSLRRRG